MNPILEILERLGLEPTRQNIQRIANRIPGYRRFADALISGADTAVDVAAGASRAAVDFGGRAAGEMLDNPVRGYGNYLRGLGSGTLGLARFLPGEGRVEQALTRLAGDMAPDEGSAQGSLGRLVGDMVPDLVGADIPLIPGRMAEAEGGWKLAELAAAAPLIPGGMSRLARVPGELDELNPRALKQAFDVEAQRVADIPVPNAKAAENAQKAARLLKEGEVSFREVPATEFHQAITAAGDTPKGGQKLADFLTIYDEGEYGGMRTFLSEDGKTGYAIKPDGDLVSVFNTGVSGAGGAAVVDGIVNGATKLDAFDPYLPALYHNFGFKPDFTSPNFEFGENPVTFMSLADDAPRTLDEIVESIGSYGDYERPALSAPGGGSEWEKAAEAFGGEDLYTGRVQPDELNYTPEDARLERLRAAGYDTSRPLYHGTDWDFDEFEMGRRKLNVPSENDVINESKRAAYLTGDPEIANIYSGNMPPAGNNIRPIFARTDNLREVDAAGREFSPAWMGEEIRQARLAGQRGVRFDRVKDWGPGQFDTYVEDTQYAMLNPEDMVSQYADIVPPPDLMAPTMGAPYVRPASAYSDRTYGLFDPDAPTLQATREADPLYAGRRSSGKTNPFYEAVARSERLRRTFDADVIRGLKLLEGRPWYELGGLQQMTDPDDFRRWNIIGSAASSQNSVPAEFALASLINFAGKRGVWDFEEAMDLYRQTLGMGPDDPINFLRSQDHFDRARLGLERGLLLPSKKGDIHYNSASWKTPSYMQARMGASDMLATIDTHERRRMWQQVMANENLRRLARENLTTAQWEAGLRDGVIPIRNRADYETLSGIYEAGANRFGFPTAAAYQAPRWTGGGVRTRLESNPTRTYQELLADQVRYTAGQRGMDTSPAGLRRLLGSVLQGNQLLLPFPGGS